MANIIKDSVHIFVRDLIAEGFKLNNNEDKSYSSTQKSALDEHGKENCRSGRKCSLKAQCLEARGN
jgi:hypothetical protein